MDCIILAPYTINPFGSFKYKAKNLFVKFPDPNQCLKRSSGFTGERCITRMKILSDLILLNAGLQECRYAIFGKFNISDAESLGGQQSFMLIVATGIKLKREK